jgi:hypothetical protein
MPRCVGHSCSQDVCLVNFKGVPSNVFNPGGTSTVPWRSHSLTFICEIKLKVAPQSIIARTVVCPVLRYRVTVVNMCLITSPRSTRAWTMEATSTGRSLFLSRPWEAFGNLFYSALSFRSSSIRPDDGLETIGQSDLHCISTGLTLCLICSSFSCLFLKPEDWTT